MSNHTWVAKLNTCSKGQRGERDIIYTMRDKEKVSDWGESGESWRQAVQARAHVWRWQDAVAGCCQCQWVEGGVKFCKKGLDVDSALWENQLHSCDSCFPLHPVKVTTVGLHNKGSCPGDGFPVLPNRFIAVDSWHLSSPWCSLV